MTTSDSSTTPNRQFSRRQFLGVAAATSATAFLAACGSSTKATSTGTTKSAVPGLETVTLTFMHSQNEGQPEGMKALNAMVAKFTDEHPGIKINQMRYENINYLNQVLPTAFAGGQPPDIFGHVGFQKLFAYKDKLLDLTDFYQKNSARYRPGLEPALADDGHYWALPWNISGSNFIWYWKDKFAELKVDPKQLSTVEGWQAINQASVTAGMQPMAFTGAAWNCGQWLQNFIDRVIGPSATTDLVTGKAGKWTDPDIVEAAQMFKDFYDRGYMGKNTVGEDWSIAVSNFLAGRTLQGGFVDSLGDNVRAQEDKTGVRQAIDVARFPTIKDGRGSEKDWVFWVLCFAASSGAHEAEKLQVLDALGSAAYQGVGAGFATRVPAALGATKGVDVAWEVDALSKFYAEAEALVPVWDLPVSAKAANVDGVEIPAMLSGSRSVKDMLANMQKARQSA